MFTQENKLMTYHRNSQDNIHEIAHCVNYPRSDIRSLLANLSTVCLKIIRVKLHQTQTRKNQLRTAGLYLINDP